MKNLKIYEDFTTELFGVPIFSPWSDEEDEEFSNIVYPILDPLQGDYFELDEPSRDYGTWKESRDLRCDNWLVSDTIKELKILSIPELNELMKVYPNTHKPYTYKDYQGMERTRYSIISKIFGNFYWYSIPLEEKKPWGKRKEMFWLIGKDGYGNFRVIHGEKKDLRNLWNNAKQFESVEDAMKDQVSVIAEIGKFFDDHIEQERDEWESEQASHEDDDYRNRSSVSWYE